MAKGLKILPHLSVPFRWKLCLLSGKKKKEKNFFNVITTDEQWDRSHAYFLLSERPSHTHKTQTVCKTIRFVEHPVCCLYSISNTCSFFIFFLLGPFSFCELNLNSIFFFFFLLLCSIKNIRMEFPSPSTYIAKFFVYFLYMCIKKKFFNLPMSFRFVVRSLIFFSSSFTIFFFFYEFENGKKFQDVRFGS